MLIKKSKKKIFSLLLVSELVVREVHCFSPCLHVPSTSLFLSLSLFDIFTARKRSLGQGNIFTDVCLFGGSATRGRSAYGGGLERGGLPSEGGWADPPPEPEKRAVHIPLTGMLSC